MTFELTILGSSSAIPTSEKYPTAQVLNVHERFFLIDCGEGTQIRLRQMKFSFARIQHIFVSHLHGDHFFGLPGLISTRNLMGITSDFHIFSHAILRDLLRPLMEHMKGEMGFKIFFHPLNSKDPELIFSDKHVEITSFPLRHSIPCCGFLFREKSFLPNMRKDKIEEYKIPLKQIPKIKQGEDYEISEGVTIPNRELVIPPPQPRSYAFCTDTAYYEPAAEIIEGADLLYHEATFHSSLEQWAQRTFHSTAGQAASLAKLAQVKKLIIGHLSSRYKDENALLLEAQAIFPQTELAFDGGKFAVSQTRTTSPNFSIASNHK